MAPRPRLRRRIKPPRRRKSGAPRSELKILQREADALTAQARTLIAELRKLELDRQIRGQEVARAQAEVELAAAELATAEAETRRLHGAVEAERPVVASRLADLYKLGRPGYWRMLLSVDDLQSVGRTFRTVTTIAQQDRERIEGYSRTLAALADTRTTMAKRAEAAAGTRAQAQAARAALERAVAAQSARIEEIDARRDLNAQLTGELQEAARQLPVVCRRPRARQTCVRSGIVADRAVSRRSAVARLGHRAICLRPGPHEPVLRRDSAKRDSHRRRRG